MRDMLLVLDFDHLAARTIARKLRSERICCKILPGDASMEDISAKEPLGLVLAGSAAVDQIPVPDARLLSQNIPVLALSSMAVWLCGAMGGEAGEDVLKNELRSVRYADCTLLDGLEAGDRMLTALRKLTLPHGASVLAAVEDTQAPLAFSDAAAKLFGVQLDIEQHDPEGTRLLLNFALNICGCTSWWDEDAFVLRSVQEIKRVVGEGTAMCAMTGGLNSGVSALLAQKALGGRLKCVFVDTGLLRENEGEAFMAYYHDRMGLDITRIPAKERFFEALRGKTRAEEKRAVIGTLLKTILEEEQAKIPNLVAIIKGTSYNDVLCAPTASAQGEPMLYRIEPVMDLFKDEIRQVGEYLGMPADIISSQPFPGSGLALRILGEVTRERLETLRRADAIFRKEVEASGQGKRLWQHFAVLSPLEDLEGDVICLRAVHATDGALAYPARLPYDLLETVVSRILKECKTVCRVAYDMTPSDHYSGIEWQ